jgi:hypothetical protein
LSGGQFTAQVAINIEDGANLSGRLTGILYLATARFEGKVAGVIQRPLGKGSSKIEVQIQGCLRPDRIVNVGQYHGKQPVGGVSFQIQVPLPAGTCFEVLPPTDTLVKPSGLPGRVCVENATALLECLDLQKKHVNSIDIRSVLVELKFKGDCD